MNTDGICFNLIFNVTYSTFINNLVREDYISMTFERKEVKAICKSGEGILIDLKFLGLFKSKAHQGGQCE